MFPKSLLLIGYGKMGSALCAAWIKAGMKESAIVIVDADAGKKSLEAVDFIPECIVLAVKPQSMDALLPTLKNKFGETPLYISIAAGKTIAYFEQTLGDATIIRVMPNTPALIGKGISAIIGNKKARDSEIQTASTLFKAAGEVVMLKDEKQMDAVTAISGSGPAYVFLFLESLIEAGIAQGLDEATAKKLAIETLIGSAELAKSSSESLTTLRANVTSKGGTTEAALNVLMKDSRLKSLFNDAVAAAVKRAKELG